MDRILSFFFMLILTFSGIFNVPLKNYDSKNIIDSSEFKNGFAVLSQQSGKIDGGNFIFGDTTPDWCIAQWNSGGCLWENRVESDKYTLTDGTTKTVAFNPDDNSVSMRLNAASVYGGEPAELGNWPHLLLEKPELCDYASLTESEKIFYNCSADRFVLNLKIRISDFKDTTNKEGINASEFLAYFYLNDVNGGDEFIWFGVNLFDSRGYRDTSWSFDESSGNMIYCVSTKDTYSTKLSSLYRFGKPYISDEWVEVQLDLKPHILEAIKKSNESNTFGKEVKAEDFYIGGTNIGFEIHGNYDCTIDIKDFSLTAYNKK